MLVPSPQGQHSYSSSSSDCVKLRRLSSTPGPGSTVSTGRIVSTTMASDTLCGSETHPRCNPNASVTHSHSACQSPLSGSPLSLEPMSPLPPQLFKISSKLLREASLKDLNDDDGYDADAATAAAAAADIGDRATRVSLFSSMNVKFEESAVVAAATADIADADADADAGSSCDSASSRYSLMLVSPDGRDVSSEALHPVEPAVELFACDNRISTPELQRSCIGSTLLRRRRLLRGSSNTPSKS
jgi:hypothetical protein